MIKIVLCAVLSIVGSLMAQIHNPIFRLEVTKDTLRIGEPMIIKCILVNQSDSVCKVYVSGSRYQRMMVRGSLSFVLKTPSFDEDFYYGVYMHVYGPPKPPSFVLEPHDSIYWYSILNWQNWSYAMKKIDYLRDLKPGYYSVSAHYDLLSQDLKEVWRISSPMDSFYAVNMSRHDLSIFEKTRRLLDGYIGYPGGTDQESYDGILKTFPEYLNVNNSIIIPFCHYILANISPVPNRIALYESFLDKYPHIALAEEVEFMLAQSYADNGDDSLSNITYAKALSKYPDNSAGYAYRHLNAKIKELK